MHTVCVGWTHVLCIQYVWAGPMYCAYSMCGLDPCTVHTVCVGWTHVLCILYSMCGLDPCTVHTVCVGWTHVLCIQYVWAGPMYCAYGMCGLDPCTVHTVCVGCEPIHVCGLELGAIWVATLADRSNCSIWRIFFGCWSGLVPQWYYENKLMTGSFGSLLSKLPIHRIILLQSFGLYDIYYHRIICM